MVCYLANKQSQKRFVFLEIISGVNFRRGRKLFKVKNNVSTNPSGYKLAIFTFRLEIRYFLIIRVSGY